MVYSQNRSMNSFTPAACVYIAQIVDPRNPRNFPPTEATPKLAPHHAKHVVTRYPTYNNYNFPQIHPPQHPTTTYLSTDGLKKAQRAPDALSFTYTTVLEHHQRVQRIFYIYCYDELKQTSEQLARRLAVVRRRAPGSITVRMHVRVVLCTYHRRRYRLSIFLIFLRYVRWNLATVNTCTPPSATSPSSRHQCVAAMPLRACTLI